MLTKAAANIGFYASWARHYNISSLQIPVLVIADELLSAFVHNFNNIFQSAAVMGRRIIIPNLHKALLVGRKLLTQMQSLQLFIKSSVLDRNRQLIITNDHIEFDDSEQISKPPTTFFKEDINGLRYGVKWISGYQFVIGRIYCIDVRDKTNKIIKIRLKTLYGIRKKELTDKYAKIVYTLYDYFFDNISRDYITMFDNKIDFELSELVFSQKGISLNKRSDIIQWDDVGTASHKTYYTIFPKSDPKKYKAFEYLTDWNAGIVYSVSRQILKNKGLYLDQ